jgi:hypothetical protein
MTIAVLVGGALCACRSDMLLGGDKAYFWQRCRTRSGKR